MLTIRKEQLHAFHRQVDIALADRILEHLRKNHKAAIGGTPDHFLLERVQYGLARARRYGLTWDSSLVAFVALMFEIGPRFDKQRHLHQILNDPSTIPDERVDVTVELGSEEDWDEAETLAGQDDWDALQQGIE